MSQRKQFKSRRKYSESMTENCIDLRPYLIAKFAQKQTAQASHTLDRIGDFYYRHGYEIEVEDGQENKESAEANEQTTETQG